MMMQTKFMRRSFVSMNIEYDVHCASKLLQVWQEHCNKAILTRDIWEPVKWATSRILATIQSKHLRKSAYI